MELKNILSLPKSTMLNSKEFNDIVRKIPVNPIATDNVIESLKTLPNGEQPLDLIFAVKYEESKNNRIYSLEAYKSIVEQIITSDVFIPVCYGHQDKDSVSWEGRKIVGSVIGAFLDEGAGTIYYRIIPDASKDNEDIRRWLRNKQINAISIWGFSESEKNAEGVEVIKDFSLLSIDFVPPLTEGQKNVALVIGEAYNQFNNRIISNPKNNKEAIMAEEKVKIEDVSNDILQGEMTRRLKDGRLSLRTIVGEMNCKVLIGEEVEAIEAEKATLKKDFDFLLEKAKELGFKSLDELFDFTKDSLKKFEDEKLQGEFKTLKEAVLTEKGLFENGKPKGHLGVLIDRYAPIKQGMNREEIREVVEKMLSDKEITSFIGSNAIEGEAVSVRGEMLDDAKKFNSQSNKLQVFEI